MSNPFELRFKLLEMAQSYLNDNYVRSEAIMHQAWDLAKQQGDANMKLWKELQP